MMLKNLILNKVFKHIMTLTTKNHNWKRTVCRCIIVHTAALADTEATTANINTDIFFTKKSLIQLIEDRFIVCLSEENKMHVSHERRRYAKKAAKFGL